MSDLAMPPDPYRGENPYDQIVVRVMDAINSGTLSYGDIYGEHSLDYLYAHIDNYLAVCMTEIITAIDSGEAHEVASTLGGLIIQGFSLGFLASQTEDELDALLSGANK
jgi:hypothetical protein